MATFIDIAGGVGGIIYFHNDDTPYTFPLLCSVPVGSLFLIYMETLMGQIEDIITAEKRKQAWVPVSRPETN